MPLSMLICLLKLAMAIAAVMPGLVLFMPAIGVSNTLAYRRAAILSNLSPWRTTGFDTITTGRVTSGIFSAFTCFSIYTALASYWISKSIEPTELFQTLPIALIIPLSVIGIGLICVVSLLAWDVIRDTVDEFVRLLK